MAIIDFRSEKTKLSLIFVCWLHKKILFAHIVFKFLLLSKTIFNFGHLPLSTWV